LLVFDNMTRMAAQSGLSTVDPGEFGRILAALDALTRRTGASALTICHSPMSDPTKVAGSYPIMANSDVVMQAERGAGLTTTIRSVKTRDTAAAEALQLKLQVQDVQEWLLASYAAEGRSAPSTLDASDFDDPARASLANPVGGGPRPLTSLVVASGMRASVAARRATEVEEAEETEEVERDRESVRRLVAAHPKGLSKTAIRDRIGLGHDRVDALLRELERDGAITVERGRARHVYRPALRRAAA
jgi:hypothetical protein